MTPVEFRSIRETLGLTAQALAVILRVYDGSRIRKWERGAASIPGPAAALMEGMRDSEAVRAHFVQGDPSDYQPV